MAVLLNFGMTDYSVKRKGDRTMFYEYIPYRQSNAHRCLPFSHQRVRQILQSDYHCSLKPVGGYKCNRYRGYVQKYHLINDDTGEILVEWVTMNAIRILLTQEGYKLKPEPEMNPGARAFLEHVERLKNNR